MYTGIIAGSTINLTATPHAYTNPVAATTVTNTSSGNNNILLLSLPTNHKNDKSVTVLGGGDGLTHYWFNNQDGSCQNLEASGKLEAVAMGTTGASAVPQPPPAAFGTPITNQIKRICQNTYKERRSSTGNEKEKYYVTLLRLILYTWNCWGHDGFVYTRG